MLNPIEAVNVAIIKKDKVLIAKRALDKPMPGVWEFPGGKLEVGESLEECAHREIQEELELDIILGGHLGMEALEYEGKSFHIYFYSARLKDEKVEPCLSVHTEYAWVRIDEFKNYELPAAELAFVSRLKEELIG